MTKYIDLNCDLGESFGAWKMGNDDQILPFVSSVNIACGLHAGDPSVIHRTICQALKHNVAIGAHPGLPDLVGFGRRNMAVTCQEVYDLVIYQIGALQGFITALGGVLHHVKPHGALYNMAATNADLALAIAKAIYDVNKEAILYGLAGSELIYQATKLGLRTANEVFADRTYQSDGSLTPRTAPNALIEHDDDAVKQVLDMVKMQKVTSVQGKEVVLQAETVCIHGDGLHAISFAKKINQVLTRANIAIKAM